MLQLLIGRKTNDTYTYSHKIVLIANLLKEASFQIKHDFKVWEEKKGENRRREIKSKKTGGEPCGF